MEGDVKWTAKSEGMVGKSDDDRGSGGGGIKNARIYILYFVQLGKKNLSRFVLTK